MKRIIAALLLNVTFLAACGNGASSGSHVQPSETASTDTEPAYRRISAEDAYRMMLDTDGYILLDVRSHEEYDVEHIDGAVLIPVDEIGDRAEDELMDKSAVILLYCRSGRRSAAAAHELVGLGYTNVYDFGGIIDWPYDTITG